MFFRKLLSSPVITVNAKLTDGTQKFFLYIKFAIFVSQNVYVQKPGSEVFFFYSDKTL